MRDSELEIEEANVPKVPAKVYTPSAEDYYIHCATHLPQRNWCPICVQAKRRSSLPSPPPPSSLQTHTLKHDASDRANGHVPVIVTDYMYSERNDG